MRAGAGRAVITVVILLGGPLAAWAAEPPRDEAVPASPGWTLATADTTLVVGVGPDQRLYLRQLTSPAGWNWTATPSPFPLLRRADVDGMPHTLDWVFQHGVVDHADGTKLTLTFANAAPALELTSVWHARSGPGPVRHTMFVHNKADQAITIYAQESLDLQVVAPPQDARVCYINDDGSLPDPVGVYRDSFDAGYQKTLPVSEQQDFIPYALVDAGGEHGLYVGWEWSLGRMTVSGLPERGGLRLRAGSGDDFKTDLAAGETFEVPPAFLGAYQGDMDDAANSVHKYLFRYSLPALVRDDASYPKVEWNAFAATGKGQGSWDPSEIDYYPLIDAAAPLGFEEVVLDINWWQGDTTHRPHPPVGDPLDWPSGILAARDYAHAKGMRFGLYWNCNPAMTTVEGMQHRRDDARQLYDGLRVDFIRSDGTDGNVLQTGSYGPGTRAHYAQDAGYWQTKGYYEVLDSLSATIPNFAYENCSGGGRIKDYGILRRCTRIQNQDRYYPIDARRAFYDASYAIHPLQIATLCGSWAEWQAAGSVYEFRSASLGAAYWHPDAPHGGNGGPIWTDSQKALVQQAVSTYKTQLRPLIRHANLYHIFPRPDDKAWDGVEYYDPAAGKGAVYVFRPDSPLDSAAIVFKGLDAKARYWLWCEDGSLAPTEQTGADLMRSGLTLSLPEPLSSEIVFLQDAALGKPAELHEPDAFALKPAKTAAGLLATSAELDWEASRNARLYRVTLGGTPDFREVLARQLVAFPPVVFPRLPPCRTLSWKVEALAHGGPTLHSGPCGTFCTPDILARGVTFASDVPWVRANAGAENPVRRDVNLHGQPVHINGRRLDKALWTHACNDSTTADIVFDLDGRGWAVFKATVGLDDAGEKGSVQFQVLVDGQSKAESPIMLPRQSHEMVVELAGARELTLRVLNAGDGYGWDHAVWGLARFLDAHATDPWARDGQAGGR